MGQAIARQSPLTSPSLSCPTPRSPNALITLFVRLRHQRFGNQSRAEEASTEKIDTIHVVVEQDWRPEMIKFARKLFGDNKGATAIEYGLIAALIAVAAIAAMDALGTTLNNTFTTVEQSVKV